MDFDIASGLEWYIVFLLSTSWHEAAHALVGLKLGDDTAHRGGQVSLDPTPHIKREPFGMVVVPLLSFFLGGWMVGWASAPYDPEWAARYPRRSALVSLAGPATNFSLALIAGILMLIGFRTGIVALSTQPGFMDVVAPTAQGNSAWVVATEMLSLFFSLNLLLGLFNLLPLPPLDGSNLPFLFLSESAAEKYREFLSQPALGTLGLLVAWTVFGPLFDPLYSMALRTLYFFAPGQ